MKRTDGQKRLSARLTHRKAFTLVELLVVIAIIGILFVVLISKVDFATEKAKALGVQTDFRSYQFAIETVARENEGLSTLVDNDASGEEKYAALEAALNKNLDPKLRVEIDENGNITTDAKDPWKEQYLGTYLTPDADGTVKDRGAIVMYSKGSNLKLGSTAEITNGVVNVTIESGKEKEGADDYAISTIYTYVNGYGEIKTTTDGFSNDMGDENTNQGNNTPSNPADPNTPTEPSNPTDPDTPTDPEQGGEQEPVRLAAGLYDAEDNLVASWDELVNTYGMDIEKNYTVSIYSTDAFAPYYVLTNHDALSTGTKLVISDDVERVGDFAFYSLASLTNVDFGFCVTSIGSKAFYCCSGLTGELVIPESVTNIGSSAFSGCHGLTSISVPNSVTSIGSGAFSGCTGLTGVEFGSGITRIESETFKGCSGLINIIIPDGVTFIGGDSFNGCSELTSVTIPNSVTGVGSRAFQNCSKLTSIYIGSGVTSISKNAFQNCSGLTGVYITDIAAWCKINFISEQENPLYRAKKLYLNNELITTLVIPDEITEIKQYVFYNAQNIQSVIIPNSVTSIGSNAFYGCSGLTGVYITDLAKWCQIDFASIGSNPLYCTKNLYLNNAPITNLVIPDEITEIKQYTFYNAQNITGTTIHNRVTSIGNGAFMNCSGLTGDLVIPEGITSIESSTFCNCSGLTSITIPNSVTSIEGQAFSGCSGLTGELVIPNNVTTIGKSAFYNCSGLTSVIIGPGITNIGEAAFQNCSGLTGVYITDLAAWCNIDFGNANANPLYCARNLYLNNESIQNLVIPDEITEIKQYTFYNAKNITGTTIHNSVTSIGKQAFCSCSGLTSVVIPDSVTSIGTSAFNTCSELTSVVIPDSVTSIGAGIFSACFKLTTVTLESVVLIPYDTFLKYSCQRLTIIYVPADLVEQYKAADGWIDLADKIQAIPTT